MAGGGGKKRGGKGCMRFNTGIAAMMEFVNGVTKVCGGKGRAGEEESWAGVGGGKEVCREGGGEGSRREGRKGRGK